MDAAGKRFTEVRLLLVVTVEINHEQFVDLVRNSRHDSVARVVSAEVVSNLESMPYVGAVVAVQL